MQKLINAPYDCEKLPYLAPIEDDTMEDETHSLSKQLVVEDPQDDTEIFFQYEEDVDTANENLDAGNNFEYNSEDTEMVSVYEDQEDQVKLQDFSVAKSN